MFDYLVALWSKVMTSIGYAEDLTDKLEDVAECVDEVIENIIEENEEK